MRLLDVHELTLKFFPSKKDRPQYAILSHTWGDGEVTFQDLTSPAVESMPGSAKIKQCCKEAKMLGFDYVWIDTCCIDKTSSAELSEAINSMYQWYQSSTICFAYISDFKSEPRPDYLKFQLSKARWFTRGWTLQELIAPEMVVFYNNDWVEIGTKHTLSDIISDLTDIPKDVLLNNVSLHDVSIANRMSWAAKRETTRTEDIAYSLMGIFGVNMPTLYGEGDNAFIRLQHEIMKGSDDPSLFAWSCKEDLNKTLRRRGPRGPSSGQESINGMQWVLRRSEIHETGLLSTSPRNFPQRKEIKRINVAEIVRHPFAMTNHGLHIWLPLIKAPDPKLGYGIYQAVLNCEASDMPGSNMTIYLKEDTTTRQFSRIYPDTIHIVNDLKYSAPQEIFVKELYLWTTPVNIDQSFPLSHFRLHLRQPTLVRSGYNVVFCSHKIRQDNFDIAICRKQGCRGVSGDSAIVLLSAKANPSVRALIFITISDCPIVSAVVLNQGQLRFPPGEVNACLGWTHEMLMNGFGSINQLHFTADSEGEKMGVGKIDDRWKFSVSLRRGATTLLTGENNCELQHFHFTIAFIQSPVSSQPDPLHCRSVDDILKWKRLQIKEAVSVGFPKLNVKVIQRNAASTNPWPKEISTNTTRHDGRNVIFSLPHLHWEIKEDSSLYQWIPTAGERRAVMALQSKDRTTKVVLELFLDEEFKVQHLLRDPNPEERKIFEKLINGYNYSPDLEAWVWRSMMAKVRDLSNQRTQQASNGFITIVVDGSTLDDGDGVSILEVYPCE